MYILLASMEFASLTGQPMYNYNLAKGLREMGHEVTCMGPETGGAIKKMLEDIGCEVYKFSESSKWIKFYDLAIVSEHYPQYLDFIFADKIFNFCHSKDIADKPIMDKRIHGYLAPREQVSEHWQKEYDIDFTIVPIPIDFERFGIPREKQKKYITLAPCTRCELRKPMLLDLISRCNKENSELWLVGDDMGALDGVAIPEHIKIFPATPRIEDYMKKADEVAGIFIGTVTLEAWAMGIDTLVYDEKGNGAYVRKPDDFDKHNYKNVAKQIIKLYEV
jgi:hypothetical protein